MNGASEATLSELLASNQEQTAVLRQLAAKLSSGSGGGGAGAGGGGAGSQPPNREMGIFGKSINAVSGALGSTLHGAIGLASTAFSAISATGKGVWEAQKQLSQTAIDGSGKLSSFADSLSGLPGILGMIAQAESFQLKKLEANLHTYQQITDAGAAFGGSLTEVRKAAMGTGLSMSEFAASMKENGPALIKLGMSADDGAKKLVKFNTDLIKGEVGQGLLGLGYSLTEVNGLLGSYATVVGGLSADQLRDQKRMEQSVAAFATEMDMSAQLEGKSRKQKEDEMKRASANAAVQAKLATMTQDQKDKYEKALSNALRTGGQGAADALNSTLLGLPPMTKEAQTFAAMMPEANAAVQDNAAIVKDNSTYKESENKIVQNGIKGQIAAKNAIDDLGETTAAAISMGDKANAVQGVVNNGLQTKAQLDRQGIKTEADAQKQQEAITAEQEKRKKSEAGKAAQAEARAKYQAGLMDRLNAALAKLFPVVVKIVEVFTKFFEIGLDFGTKLLDQTIIPAFETLFGGIRVDDIIKPFKDFFGGIADAFGGSGGISFKSLKDNIVGFFKPILEFVHDLMGAMDFKGIGKSFGGMLIKFKEALGSIMDGISFAFGGGGPSGAGVGKALSDGLKKLFEILGDIAASVGEIIKKILMSEGFQKLKEAFGKFVDLLKKITGVVLEIVQGPVGTAIIDGIMDVFGILGDTLGFLIDAVSSAIDVAVKFVDWISQGWPKMWEDIKLWTKKFLDSIINWFKSLPEKIVKIFADGWQGLKDAISGILDGVISGIKNIASGILDLFSSKKDSAGKDTSASTPTASQQPNKTQAAAANTQEAIDKVARDWAYSVYTGKNSINQVPKDMVGKVNDLLKNPPNEWKSAGPNAQKDTAKDTKSTTALDTKKAPEIKETPAIDLNNKDVVTILKTMAEYERRMLDAIRALNGNLLKT